VRPPLVGPRLFKLAIEGLAANEEARLQHSLSAVSIGDATAQDAGPPQGEEAVDQHLRATVETRPKGTEIVAVGGGVGEPFEQVAEGSVVGVAQDQRVCQGVRERTDPDPQWGSILDTGGSA